MDAKGEGRMCERPEKDRSVNHVKTVETALRANHNSIDHVTDSGNS